MKNYLKSDAISIGLAMFSMFFGAGNVIFPLAVGQYAGDRNLFAVMGLILTAVVMPIAGVIAMILFDGNYRQFFGRLGKLPGLLLGLTIITLLGPLGSTPRCIALSYSTLKASFPQLSPIIFSAIACLILLGCSIRKNHIVKLLGWVLTPLLLGSLMLIIIAGLFSTATITTVEHSNVAMFIHGLKEGYNTMDLLAAFFISSSIIATLKMRNSDPSKRTSDYLNLALRASIVGAFLLSIVYIGFSYIASFHGDHLSLTGKDELLTAITMRIAGPYAGLLVCVTIALACLTTAIALISMFADFFQKEILQEKISYEAALAGSVAVTFMVSTFEFTGISAFLGPILQICYPGLIILTFANIAHKLCSFQPIKLPVFLSFATSAALYLFFSSSI